jgi:flagellar biosynthesis protein FliR
MGELFQLMGTLVLLAAGLDRILLASMVRSFRIVPLGTYAMAPATGLGLSDHSSLNLISLILPVKFRSATCTVSPRQEEFSRWTADTMRP